MVVSREPTTWIGPQSTSLGVTTGTHRGGVARMTTFCFTTDPDPEQEAVFRRHIGARRFAYNQCLPR